MNIEKFYKLFDEIQKTYSNVKYNLEYVSFWRMSLSINNKVIFDLRGTDTETIFNTALYKLTEYLRR